MPGKKGNRNALKHGLYAKHITMEKQSELRRMPTNDALMELAAARLNAERAMELFLNTNDPKDRAAAINVTSTALQIVVNILRAQQLLKGDSPILQDLWTAINTANRLDEVDNAV